MGGVEGAECEAFRCNRILLQPSQPFLQPMLSPMPHRPHTSHLPLCAPALTQTAPHIWTPETYSAGGWRKTKCFAFAGPLIVMWGCLLLDELRFLVIEFEHK